jgi:hypothetical protein
MTDCYNYSTDCSVSTEMNKIDATYFYDKNEPPTIVKKEFSTCIIFQTIAEDISSQYKFTFGVEPFPQVLNSLIDGFVLFNLHKNKYMLKSKDALLKYMNDRSISIEEKDYFQDIVLYKQRPKFLTFDEHEYIRACGSLDGYYVGVI